MDPLPIGATRTDCTLVNEGDQMGFPKNVAIEALVKCGRHCCICNEFAGLSIELHHIRQKADGGDDSFDNCIPLCCNCHAIVKAYNPHHPGGRAFSEEELRAHRDKCYARHSMLVQPKKRIDQFSSVFSENKQRAERIYWGFLEQEEECPIRPGMIVLVAGYSGDGKSTYIQHVLEHNLWHGMRGIYCCMKESPENIAASILANAAYLSIKKIRNGLLSDEDWERLSMALSTVNEENLKMFSGNQFENAADDIIDLVENSGAEIIVIDDLGGILLKNAQDIEVFMYRLKRAASQSGTVVFIACNISKNAKRADPRPMLKDFPSDSYYRICDIVQFIFRPSNHFEVESWERDFVEAIIVKGSIQTKVATMVINDDTAHICSLLKNEKA